MENDYRGPGTVYFRFNHLMEELEKRFPTDIVDLFRSDICSETRYLKKIDELLESKKFPEDIEKVSDKERYD